MKMLPHIDIYAPMEHILPDAVYETYFRQTFQSFREIDTSEKRARQVDFLRWPRPSARSAIERSEIGEAT